MQNKEPVMDKIWRLMTAMFCIVVAAGLFIVAYIFSGGMFNNTFAVILAYACLFCILIGITKGILVIVDYHRENKEE